MHIKKLSSVQKLDLIEKASSSIIHHVAVMLYTLHCKEVIIVIMQWEIISRKVYCLLHRSIHYHRKKEMAKVYVSVFM